MRLPPEENHEVTGFVRAVGGEGPCGGEGHCGGEGQGRERGTVSTQQAHVAPCETRALHLYTCQCSATVCENSKSLTSDSPNKEVPCVSSAVCSSRSTLGSVVVVYPPHPPQCVSVLVCVVCGEAHRQHCLVVTAVTSSLRGTHPPVSSTAVIIWRERGSMPHNSSHSCPSEVQYHPHLTLLSLHPALLICCS